ncbi:MAG: restriction endonuclease [Clostridia bacterium]|nr:restriction endonuclease [Clostridia bacterium]
MKKETKKEEIKAPVTRAEKKDATKKIVLEVLQKEELKSNDLIDETARLYAERFKGEDTENVNDVKGRAGSVIDIMKKEGTVVLNGGRYALKEEIKAETTQEKIKKTPAKRAKKAVKAETETEEKKKAEPLPPAPVQPIAPVAPITPEVAPEPIPATEEPPKKRGRKAKKKETPVVAELSVVEEKEPKKRTRKTKAQAPPVEEVKEPIKEQEEPKTELAPPVKGEGTPMPAAAEKVEQKETEAIETKKSAPATEPKNQVMDMSFLFGALKPAKRALEKPIVTQEQPTKVEPKAEKTTVKASVKEPIKAEEKKPTVEKKPVERKALQTKTQKPMTRVAAKTADEKLKEAFLKKIGWLGGDYFEYYSVYLLQRYSMKNGRRLESMKISGGEHDGGIDGEIEVTDKLGFRETIYIQSKNWHPDKGDDKLWVVGETLLQQFIGACMCKQAKEGKQHCRGIFITTSRFTPEAKRILSEMSDRIVGYDGNDLYEAAKECEFGLILKNGEWALDEKLLSGTKAFFEMY